MKLTFVVTMAALAALACADVSHLGKYNYPAPLSVGATTYTSQQAHTQGQTHSTIESITPSVQVASFSVQPNIGHGQGSSLLGYSSGQSSRAYSQNAPVQHYSAPQQQQSYSVPGSLPFHSAPSTGSIQNSLVPPAPRQQYSSVAPIQQSKLPAPAPIQQSYGAENAYLPPAPQQQYSPPTTVQQQSYPAPAAAAPVVQQSYSAPALAPVQNSYSAPATVQQQTYFSTGQVQGQSHQITGHKQQPISDVGTANLADSGGYTIQAQIHQQSFPSSVPAPNQQSYSAPVLAPVQHSLAAPVTATAHQNVPISANVESGSYSYQPTAPVQQHFSAPVQQQYSTPVQQQYSYTVQQQQQHTQLHSVPAAKPVQQSASISSSDSNNYQPAAPAQPVAPVGQSHSRPISTPPNVEYLVPAPQKINSPLPALELTAPAPTPQIATAYGKNGGYVYRKF